MTSLNDNNPNLVALRNVPYKNSLFVQNKETQEIIAIGGLRLLAKYCPKTNKWIDLEELTLNETMLNGADTKFYGDNGLCINPRTNSVYVFAGPCYGQMVLQYIIFDDSFELEGKYFEIDNHGVDGCGARAIMEYDYKNCHIVGHKGHFKYNFKANKMELLHVLKDVLGVSNLYCHEMIMVNKSKLLLFGGSDGIESKEFGSIYEYGINNNKWETLATKMPYPMCSFAICAVVREQFLLFFDCSTANNGKIWIYDVQHQRFISSKLNCSKNGYIGNFKAFMVYNEKNDRLTTFGYVRKQAMECVWYRATFIPT